MTATTFTADRRSILAAGATATAAIASEMGGLLETTRTFAPVAWLARFEAVGGSAWMAGGKLAVGWRVDGCTDNKQALAREIYGEIERDDGNRKEVEDLLRKWELAVCSVTGAEIVERQFYRDHVEPIYFAQSAGLATLAEVYAVEDVLNAHGGAHTDAVNALSRTPAPTLEALKVKIATAHSDGLFDGTHKNSDAAIEAILSDISRLLG